MGISAFVFIRFTQEL